jgi:hypothetical protein
LFVSQIVLIQNDLDLLLDEAELEGKKRDRTRLLERSLLLSIRGLELLREEPLIEDAEQNLEDMWRRADGNIWRVAEELRQDSTTLKLFLGSECQLLRYLGLSEGSVARINDSLRRAIREGQALSTLVNGPTLLATSSSDGLRNQISSLVDELVSELNQIYRDDRHRALVSKLVGVFETLGGALVVAGNTAVGAAAAPATVGLSVVGAGVSTILGAEIVSRGIDRAKGGTK